MSFFSLFKAKKSNDSIESKQSPTPEKKEDKTWNGAPEWANKKILVGLREYWANEAQYAPTINPSHISPFHKGKLLAVVIAERELSNPLLKYQLYTSEMGEEHSKRCAELRKEAIKKEEGGMTEENPKHKPVHWNREAFANLAGFFDGEELELLPEQNLVKFLLKRNLIDEDAKDDVEKAARLVIRFWHKDPWSKLKIEKILKGPAISLKCKDGKKHKVEDEIRLILNMAENPFMTEKQAIEISSKGYVPMTILKKHFNLVEG